MRWRWLLLLLLGVGAGGCRLIVIPRGHVVELYCHEHVLYLNDVTTGQELWKARWEGDCP